MTNEGKRDTPSPWTGGLISSQGLLVHWLLPQGWGGGAVAFSCCDCGYGRQKQLLLCHFPWALKEHFWFSHSLH